MSNSRNIWDRIPFDADEPDPTKAELPDVETELQQKIDALCRHYNSTLFGVRPTGEILGRVARSISEIVGRVVVVNLVPMETGSGSQLAGYALPVHPVVPKAGSPFTPEQEEAIDEYRERRREEAVRRVQDRSPLMGVPAEPRRPDEPRDIPREVAERLERLRRRQ